MDPPTHSLASIKAWAEEQFPLMYKNLPGAGKFKVQLHRLTGRPKNIKGLIIGRKYNTAKRVINIHAWRSDSGITVGYSIPNKESTEILSLEKTFGKDIEFYEPFCFTLITRSALSVARFEALVHYFFIVQGSTIHAKDGFESFRSNFPGACADIAAGIARKQRPMLKHKRSVKMEVDDNDDDDTGSDNNPPPRKQSRRTPRSTISTPQASQIVDFASPSPSPQRTKPTKSHTATQLPTATSSHHESQTLSDKPVPRSQPPQILSPAHGESEKEAEAEEQRATHAMQKTRITELRRKLFDANIKLMIAEGLARTAEKEAAAWKARFEEVQRGVGGRMSSE
ncbi:hypothetical protein J1614_001343 [Plenodomus biglobosus]|nr:hypothetical protein J1614_001343 [Plenodomus biglobosus]